MSEEQRKPGNYDSLVLIGNECLKRLDYQCAKESYVHAFLSGMSRDSLCYFIASLYLRKGFPDTAIVYNLACTTKTSAVYQPILEQRHKIFSALNVNNSIIDANKTTAGKNDQKPSVSTASGIIANLSYVNSATNRYSLFGDNTYDTSFVFKIPTSGFLVYYDYFSKKRWGKFIPFGTFSLGSSVPLEKLWMRNIDYTDLFFLSDIKLLNYKNRQIISNYLKVDYILREKINIFESVNYEIPFKISPIDYLSRIYGNITLEDEFKLRESQAGVSLSGNKFNERSQYGITMGISYNWKRNQTFLQFIEGYTDSLVKDSRYRYYFDGDCTVPFENMRHLPVYWNQLSVKPWITMPGQSLNAVTMMNGLIKFGKSLSLESSVLLEGKMFLEKARWYDAGESDLSFFNKANGSNVIVVIHDKSSSHIYSLSDPCNITYDGGVVPVNYYESRRCDGILYLQSSIRFKRPGFGDLILCGWFSKSVSTLNQDEIGIPLPNHNYGGYIEWKSPPWHQNVKEKTKN